LTLTKDSLMTLEEDKTAESILAALRFWTFPLSSTTAWFN
jgi:hypothetical protein